MKIAVFSSKAYDREFLSLANNDRHQLIFHEVQLNPATVVLAQSCDAVCCFVNDILNAEILQQLKNYGISLVVLRCAGFNQVDLAAAKALGIVVARVPEYSPHAIAEHTLGLILMLNRHLHRAHYRIRENDYSLNGLLGFDLVGKTVAVVGTGKIGRTFARIMSGIGCRVIAYDPFPHESLLRDDIQYVTLAQVWAQADIISLHCPLTPTTHHLINADTIAQMRTGVMLINTGRGGLIDTRAVIQGLKERKIGYLGLDVYEEEADLFFEDNSNQLLQDDVFARLLTFPNVVITGHQAFFTREAMAKIGRVTLENIHHFEAGELAKVHRVE